MISLGSSALYAGDRRWAQALLEESLALSREVGYKEGVAWSLNQLGVLAHRAGDHRRATDLLGESLQIHRSLGDRWRAASVLEGLAEAFCSEGRLEPAARLFGASKAVREAISAPVPLCERADHKESISAARAGMGEAAFGAAFSEGRAMSLEQAIEYALGTEGPPPRVAPGPRGAPGASPDDVLTRREREIALLVARNLTNHQISREVSISEYTVAAHLETYHRPDGSRWGGQDLHKATGGVVTRSYVISLRKGRIENRRALCRCVGAESRRSWLARSGSQSVLHHPASPPFLIGSL